MNYILDTNLVLVYLRNNELSKKIEEGLDEYIILRIIDLDKYKP